MVKKEDILAKLLVKDGSIKNYVILCEDVTGRYLKYAFIDGYPEHYNMLPQWSSELPANDGSVYELSGFTSDHWAFKDAAPVDVNRLLAKTFTLSVNDIYDLIK